MDKYYEFQKEQLKMANIILLVYDVTDKQSFEDIAKWFKLIKENSIGR
jgi:GTPase SAR1 family protein